MRAADVDGPKNSYGGAMHSPTLAPSCPASPGWHTTNPPTSGFGTTEASLRARVAPPADKVSRSPAQGGHGGRDSGVQALSDGEGERVAIA